jgi:hypothetical protein
MGRIAGIVVVTAVLAVLAPGRFGGGGPDTGGPLRWQAPARTSVLGMSPDDRLLFGHVVNHSDRRIRLRAADVHVLDGKGDKLPGSAAFADGFVPGVTLRGYDTELFASTEGGGAPVGQDVVLAPGQSAPLSVSFTASGGHRATAIDYGRGALKLQ